MVLKWPFYDHKRRFNPYKNSIFSKEILAILQFKHFHCDRNGIIQQIYFICSKWKVSVEFHGQFISDYMDKRLLCLSKSDKGHYLFLNTFVVIQSSKFRRSHTLMRKKTEWMSLMSMHSTGLWFPYEHLTEKTK